MMNNWRDALVSVGKSCFIYYYKFFINDELNREDIS